MSEVVDEAQVQIAAMESDQTLKINEIFGPTIQGEGPSTGQHCLFIRLARCQLSCTWCDTPYTWATTEAKAEKHQSGVLYKREEEEHEMGVHDILTKIATLWDIEAMPTLIVISGGEPMLQQKQLTPLIEWLLEYDCKIEIETAGTIKPLMDWRVDVTFNVSPKLAHSGNTLRARRNEKALSAFASLGAGFKFVISHEDHFAEIEEIAELAVIPRKQIWAMPEGTTPSAVKEHALAIVDRVMAKGWNLTLRNHVTLWGDERGK